MKKIDATKKHHKQSSSFNSFIILWIIVFTPWAIASCNKSSESNNLPLANQPAINNPNKQVPIANSNDQNITLPTPPIPTKDGNGTSPNQKNPNSIDSNSVDSNKKIALDTNLFYLEGTQPVFVIGRADKTSEANQLILAWSGITIQTVFTGTSISVNIKSLPTKYNGRSANSIYEIIIDNTSKKITLNDKDSSYLLEKNLAEGNHTLTMVKTTEPMFGVDLLSGFSLDEKAVFIEPAYSTKVEKIEFIGDSVLAGYGILENNPSSKNSLCTNIISAEDVTKSFSWLVSKSLQVEASYVAYSGKGIHNNSNTSDKITMYQLYPSSRPDEVSKTMIGKASDFDASVLLIMLGTNDLINNGPKNYFKSQDFITVYVNFIKQLNKDHPKAKIIVMLSPTLQGPSNRENMISYLTEVVKEAQTTIKNVQPLVVFPAQIVKNGVGCDGQPNQSTHQSMATQLLPILKKIVD